MAINQAKDTLGSSSSFVSYGSLSINVPEKNHRKYNYDLQTLTDAFILVIDENYIHRK